jgi:Tripartite tricarboxylate transporter family receptor
MPATEGAGQQETFQTADGPLGGPFLKNGNCDSFDAMRRHAMKIPRRKLLRLAAGAAALTAIPRLAFPQAYPTRPVRWIVAVAPGGGNDVFARLMGQWLSEHLGQPFIVENRPGAGNNIGTEAVVKAPSDGYTLLLASSNTAVGIN